MLLRLSRGGWDLCIGSERHFAEASFPVEIAELAPSFDFLQLCELFPPGQEAHHRCIFGAYDGFSVLLIASSSAYILVPLEVRCDPFEQRDGIPLGQK